MAMWPCFEPQCPLHQISEKPDWDSTRPCALGKRSTSMGSSEVGGTAVGAGGELAPLLCSLPSGGPGLRCRARRRRPSGAGQRQRCPPLADVPGGGGQQAGSAPSPPPPGAGPSVLGRCCCSLCICCARGYGSVRSTAVAPRCPRAHPSRAMQPGAALQAMLLAALLAGPRGATGRLLSGE